MSFKVHCGLPILRVGPCHTRLSKGCISCCIAFWNPCFRGQHKASQTSRSKLRIEQLMTPKWYAGGDKHQQNGCPKKPTHQPTPPGRPEEKRIPEKFGDPSTSKQLHFKTHQEQMFCFSTFRGCHSIGFWNPPLLAKAGINFNTFRCLHVFVWSPLWYLRLSLTKPVGWGWWGWIWELQESILSVLNPHQSQQKQISLSKGITFNKQKTQTLQLSSSLFSRFSNIQKSPHQFTPVAFAPGF